MHTPVTISFRGKKERKPNAKAAYMSLITSFHQQMPDIFDHYVKRGEKRADFAHSPEELFPGTPKLADKGFAWGQIKHTNWFANTHTQTAEKVDRLQKLAEIGGFVRGVDWTWEEH